MVSTRLLRGSLIAAFLSLAGMTAAQAASVTLKVVSARSEQNFPSMDAPVGVLKGAVVSDYKYIINIDNTGTTEQRAPNDPLHPGCSPQDAGYPDTCHWTSIAGAASNSPVYTQGDQTDFATTGLSGVPDGRYLISVLADGYKLDGRHFTVDSTKSPVVTWEGKAATDPATEVMVELQPAPLPDAQIQAAVFEDISPVNSAPDLPAEHGLAGFQGHITDYLGEVTTNVYGDPLCTIYDSTGGAIPGSGGRCLSRCYVVDGGVDIGTVTPDGWTNPNTPNLTNASAGGVSVGNSSQRGRCPVPVINDETGTINAIPLYDVNGIARLSTCSQGGGGVGTGNRPCNVPSTAAIEGKVKIPNLGPNRYALSVTPPDGSGWVQTTTLEGNHDWDAWVMEGATGLDTEFVIAGEPFPAIIFGYIPAPATPSAYVAAPTRQNPSRVVAALPNLNGSATITGVVDAVKIYVPTTGGIPGLPGAIWGGLQGAKIDKPIEYPWVTLTNLGNGDTIVWAGTGDVNGKFTIPRVPAGTYTLTWWDEPQNQILDLVNVTVANGETVDMGILPLAGWWTFYDGYVFNDTNRNGIKDDGEPGLPGYTLTMRKRDNSLMDRGSTVVTTDAVGYYKFEAAYPMTQFLVMEAYDDLHYTTGVTYQADNQPDKTTVLGAGVDVSVHPIIGLSGTMDWGKHTYDPLGNNCNPPRSGIDCPDPKNGGIVGTVSYDTTRNELDPRYAAVEDWQPSIPNLTVNLYKPVLYTDTVPCVPQDGTNTGTATCDPSGRYALASDGSIAHGPLLNTYVTETWQRPTDCVARNIEGTPLTHGVDEQVLPVDDSKGCIEAPLMGVQFSPYATDQGTPDANFGAAVDGNYGFGDACFNGTLDATDPSAPACNGGTFEALPAGDYLVQVDLSTLPDAKGNPIYKVTREEDINIGNGDEFVPAVPPSACAGALHAVDSSGNANFPGGPGTSPYEGLDKPLCDTKLVTLNNGKSIAPAFNIYTDVPLPGRHWFIIIDDLNFSSNPKSVTYGEKAGMPFVPVGIYDYTDRLIKTVESDYNGLADVLLPSTNRISCPTPSGVCGNLYRYVGNDPGVPGRLNTNYDPSFRTIAAEFEVLPGMIIPADLAPTQVGVTVQLPGGQNTSPISCKLDAATPELYAVSRPYVTLSGNAAARTFTISGKAFGNSGRVLLDGTALTSGVTWGATNISVTLPGNTSPGPKQMTIVAANGQHTVNGLTIHALGSTYNPNLYEVGPSVGVARYRPSETLPAAANHAIQNALDDASNFVNQNSNNSSRGALVVVYPNNPSANPRQNPRGAYYENLIITAKVKLQGVGSGSPDGVVRGTIIDGEAFAGDSPVATDWYAKIGALTWSGNQTVYDGAVISLYLPQNGRGAFPTTASANTWASIDGFDLRGGDQQGFPGNINAIGGGPTGLPGGLITQGGAIFANAYAYNLQITNNVVQNNGGAYGTIRVGTPDLTGDVSSHNANVTIAYNRVIANAGTNQAGGIGLFNGSNAYHVAYNDICGNFSAEYGGGVSAVGYSPGGTINNNRIYFNRSYDEGGGIMIAGALPANTTTLSPGSGPVDIYANLIQANLANDDGGGLRFLMSGTDCDTRTAGFQACPQNVYNNFIVNNISTHEGGGISINDAPNVRVMNNTIMKNLTTATAITSNGAAAPAGLSTSANSALLQGRLPAGSPSFSNPLLFNNIFWDNRAGSRAAALVTGLGAAGDATPIDYWDVGETDTGGLLSPTNSIIQQNSVVTSPAHPYTASPTNSTTDPAVTVPYDVGVTFNAWRNNPAFLGAIMISADLPPNLMGDYHLAACPGSPACNLGAANKAVPTYQQPAAPTPYQATGATQLNAPTNDYDGNARPQFGGFDAGADEIGAAEADLSITKTDGVTSVNRGGTVTYTVVVTNNGPNTATAATVTDNFPGSLTVTSWSCGTVTAGSSCAVGGSGSNRTATVTLLNGGSATITAGATVAANASGNVVNTATVSAAGGTSDPNTANNSATDTDLVVLPLPAVGALDNFNRANAASLGTNWATAGTIAVNTNQASSSGALFGALPATTYWNVPNTGFAATQGAAFMMANTTVNGDSLILKASGTVTLGVAQNAIRVRYNAGQVTVETTTNTGVAYTNRGAFAATFVSGNTLTARANNDGSVDVWQNTTYLGRSAAVAAFAGGGRIGMQLPNGARVDNFTGGNL